MNISNKIIKIVLSVVLIFFVFPIKASVNYIEPQDESGKSIIINSVNLFFESQVSKESIGELRLALDKININYSQVKIINLFISSVGGEMNAGLTGSLAIKSSSIPVRTINTAFVASAATMLFCASNDRYMMKNSLFLLHPPAFILNEQTTLKPDAINRLRKENQFAQKEFLDTYLSCTKYSKKETKKILSSEYLSKTLTFTEAYNVGLVKGELSVFPRADMSIYISDEMNK